MTDSSTSHSHSTFDAVALATAEPAHINTLLHWFHNADDMFQWGGPGIAFPTDNLQFLRDIGWLKLASFALVYKSELLLCSEEQALLGFAQVYHRLGRYHFGRVAISPHKRGQQLGQRFLSLLCEGISNSVNQDAVSATFLTNKLLETHPQGGVDVQSHTLALPFSATGFSLFVLRENKSAIRCYEKVGFTVQPYPEVMPGGLKDCLYMVKEKL